MINVAIVGATGYAGAELARILTAHPGVSISLVTSRQYAGKAFSDIYPAMSGLIDLKCVPFDAEIVSDSADIVFTALPHQVAMGVVPGLLDRGTKVIDLSADFRFQDVSLYEKWYQAHKAPSLLKIAVYGLPEINLELIRNSSLVGNPGCYPTSAILPLAPFVTGDLISLNSIVIDSKSGASGAGRSLSLTTHFCEVHEGLRAYKVASHRHAPEIEEVLSRLAARTVTVTFTPHLVPMSRGMLTTIYADILGDLSPDAVHDLLVSYYNDKPFVRIMSPGKWPDTLHVRGSNYTDIGFQVDKRANRLILISAIDNLVKGASGQAVQNMNIMQGLSETSGLLAIPFPV